MNADERGLKTKNLAAFIGVHRRLKLVFSASSLACPNYKQVRGWVHGVLAALLA
jgi:hypothetical protein